MNEIEQLSIIEEMWNKYNKYKDTAEQSQFVMLMMLDAKLTPAYNNLKKRYNSKHADIFIRGMQNVFKKLGIQ